MASAKGRSRPWSGGARRGERAPLAQPGRLGGDGRAGELILPCGAAGPAFLLFPNHFVIRKYNNSLSYALTIGLLASRIGGAGPLTTPWPHETPLSLEDRMAAQTALAKLGYTVGAPDGLIGLSTRQALRAWQRDHGLPADGYLSPEVVAKLKAAVKS